MAGPACRQTLLAVLLPLAGLVGCAAFDSDSSPDVIYSDRSGEARALQVPPDLTDVSDAEQFVLPGTAGGPISRNTLLPGVDGVRFERSGDRAFLAFDAAPEALWPRLLAFLASEGYDIDRTVPAEGSLATRWKSIGDGEDGVLGGLIGGTRDPRSRLAFRLERDGPSGARLFARRQIEPGRVIDAGNAPEWPASSSDPETTDALLARVLVWLGLDEQQSRGVLDASAAADVLGDAVVRSGAAGSQLVVHRGYLSAFESLDDALTATGRRVRTRDDSVGRIAFSEGDEDDRLVLTIEPVHVSAVRVGLVGADGRRLDATRERALFDTLVEALLPAQA